MKEFKITLDLIRPTKDKTIYIKENDLNSIKFVFEVLSEGEAFNLTGATSIRLAVQRPSGFLVAQDCVLTDGENGVCEIILGPTLYSEIGLNMGELKIIKDGATFVTRQFEFRTLNAIDI